jgi:hypothetical protein
MLNENMNRGIFQNSSGIIIIPNFSLSTPPNPPSDLNLVVVTCNHKYRFHVIV